MTQLNSNRRARRFSFRRPHLPRSIALGLILLTGIAWAETPPPLPPAAPALDPGTHIELGPASLAGVPLYRLSSSGAFERSSMDASSWQPVTGLGVRVLPEDRAGEPLPVTAYGVDPSDPERVLAAAGARVYFSTDGARSFTEVDLAGTINESTYVTALAIDPEDNDSWIVGTSYDGLYRTADGGASWTDVTAGWRIEQLYLGAGFFEEIAGLEIRPDGVLVRLGMGNGFVRINFHEKTAARLRPLTGGSRAYSAPAGVEPAAASTESAATDGNAPARSSDGGSPAAAREQIAANRTGIYLSANNASREKLPGYFDYITNHGFNSVVVDLKDDFGRITYNSALDLPRAVGAVEPLVDVPALTRMAHDRGIYVVARIVCFKDPRLYRYDSGRLALWDGARDRPWGVFRTVTDAETGEQRVVQVEHWVDPYSPAVWDYIISIAEEAASLGVDEIQFDYVRFPSDGNTATIVSRFAPEGAGRVEALEAFLATARGRLTVPIGIDVYGFNAWSRMSYLGQDIGRLGRYVDVISPMFYPSHFALPFLPALSYFDRSRVIYDEGTRRARQIAHSTGETVLIRPYVQAFLIGRELEYETPEYLRYLQIQLEGAAAAKSDGYTLWNASGRYYMLP